MYRLHSAYSTNEYAATGSTSARGWDRIWATVVPCGANGGNRWMSMENHSTSSRPTKNVGVA